MPSRGWLSGREVQKTLCLWRQLVYFETAESVVICIANTSVFISYRCCNKLSWHITCVLKQHKFVISQSVSWKFVSLCSRFHKAETEELGSGKNQSQAHPSCWQNPVLCGSRTKAFVVPLLVGSWRPPLALRGLFLVLTHGPTSQSQKQCREFFILRISLTSLSSTSLLCFLFHGISLTPARGKKSSVL